LGAIAFSRAWIRNAASLAGSSGAQRLLHGGPVGATVGGAAIERARRGRGRVAAAGRWAREGSEHGSVSGWPDGEEGPEGRAALPQRRAVSRAVVVGWP